MSSLHHEVTPTFNKAIYDCLFEVEKPGTGFPVRNPTNSPGYLAQQEVAEYLSQLADTGDYIVNDIRGPLLEILGRHGLSSEDPGFQDFITQNLKRPVSDATEDIVAAVSALANPQADPDSPFTADPSAPLTKPPTGGFSGTPGRPLTPTRRSHFGTSQQAGAGITPR